MVQNRTLDSFWKVDGKPSSLEPKAAEAKPKAESTGASTSQTALSEKEHKPVKKERKPRVLPPIAPENLPPSHFVSASYDGRERKAVINLYEPESGELYFWYDNTGHLPYCLTNLPQDKIEKIDRLVHHDGYDCIKVEDRFDPLLNESVQVRKIVAKDPLAIGGRPVGTIRDILPEDYPKVCDYPVEAGDVKVWESKIKYYQSYIYDRQLLPGMIYEVKDGNLQAVTIKETEETLAKIRELFKDATAEEQEFAEMWAKLLEYPAPKFRRAAIDIEVYSPLSNRVPDAREGACPVIATSVYSSDGEKRVLILNRQGCREGNEHLAPDIKVERFDSEEALLREVFKVLNDYPFILTFNGDDFDLRYLVHRALNLGFSRNEIPIEVGKRVCLIKYGVHIDLYKFFFNRSIQIYAFSNRYKDVSLGDVGAALLGMEKIHLEKSFGDLSYSELCQYCLRDSEITYKLTSFEDDSAMKLMLVLARISSMPMEDVSRQGVSRWIRNFMHREHRKRNLLIPNADDILTRKGKTSTTAIIKG